MKTYTITAVVLFTATLATRSHAEDWGDAIIKASGVQGGLVVHLGCGDGQRTAELRTGDSFLVRGLDRDPGNVDLARRNLSKLGIYGPVSVDTFDGRHLPFSDNLVNLLVVDDTVTVDREELDRVLCPGGVVMTVSGDNGRIEGGVFTKPWPDSIDHWTHFLHGADNNALAEDEVVGPPEHMQWLAAPKFTRHHDTDKGTYPTIRAVVSSQGRLFYMLDEATPASMQVPSRWTLVARDGFSGVLLWKRPMLATSFERRLEQVWRTLIASGDRVYVPLGPDQPLSVLDAATGDALLSLAGTEGLQEVIKDDNRLFVIDREARVLAFDAATGRQLWQWSPGDDGALVRLTMAAVAGRVFLKTEHSAVCLSAADGSVAWRHELPGPERTTRLKYPHEKLIVKDGVVLVSYAGKDPASLNKDSFEFLGSHPRVREYDGRLAALSAEDGDKLWETTYMPGLESMPGELYVSKGQVWLGPDFTEPRDLQTGEVRATRPVLDRLWTTGHHYRCYPGKATSRFILTAKRGIEMFDMDGDDHSRNNWVRGTCRVGVTPCNGLLYTPPHSCGCYMEAKLYGFWALAAKRGGQELQAEPLDSENRLQRGPAYDEVGQPLGNDEGANATAVPSGWWTYRGDAQRTGATASPLPSELNQNWRTELGGRLSPVTVAEGKLFVAQVDAHTVHALDANSGQRLWHFTTGGRVDSPPTLHQGLALFGSRDGWVYCLRAEDGKLAWRFRAAPQDTGAVAFEQLESLWPVHGSVLVKGGIAYAAAGRSSYLDGGIQMVGLHPASGQLRCERRVSSPHTGASDPPSSEQQEQMAVKTGQNSTDYKTFLAPDRSDAFAMEGALSDVLVSDGQSIYLRHLRFDQQLRQQQEKRPHLFATSSLLDGTENHRMVWVLGTGDFHGTTVAFPWIVHQLSVPYGLMLSYDDDRVWGVHRPARKSKQRGYHVFAMPRPDPTDEVNFVPDFKRRESRVAEAAQWVTPLPLRPRAMLRAGDVVFYGGMPDTLEAKSGEASATTGILQAVSITDGTTVARKELLAPPVWDGLAASGGHLFVATADGAVVCLGE